VEENVEKVEKASKKLKESVSGMNLYQQDLLREGPAEGGNPMGVSAPQGGGGIGQDELRAMIADILANQKEGQLEREENKTAIQLAKEHRAKLEQQIKGGLANAEGKFNEVLAVGANPMGFAKGKLMGMVGKAGIYGFIALMVYRVGETLWNEYLKTFKAGGVNDIRKIMLDRDKEIAELDDIIQRRAGRVFFTGDVDLHQGPPLMSNTERLRDGVMRYNALHLGE
jgi:hypothetical protein